MSQRADGWLLLVEDSADDRELTTRALRRGCFAGPVETAENGVEALDLLFCRGRWGDRDPGDVPVVVLLDLKMPFVDGIETLTEIKRSERLRDVPVVMLTSSAQEIDLERCYALGANSYIVKPVDIDQFFHAVQELGRYWTLLNHPAREALHGLGSPRSDP